MTKSDNRQSWEEIDGSSVPQRKIDTAFKAVMAKVQAIESSKKEAPKPSWRRATIRAAAAVIAVMAVTALSLAVYSGKNPLQSVSMKEYYAQNGEVKTIFLDDSTKVVMNSGSVLIYPESFKGKERSVYLSGEAEFDVTKDKDHPFIVKTSEISVKVHGTRFNVKAYPEDNIFAATLSRGSVSVFQNDHENTPTLLVPGQEFSYDRSDKVYSVKQVDAQQASAWENGSIYLEHEDIDGIIRTIERRYNVHIYLTTDRYSDAVITAKFVEGESLEDLMDVISRLVPGMRYTVRGKDVYIR
jgi:transmembrane sensor